MSLQNWTLDEFNENGREYLFGLLGMEVVFVGKDQATFEMVVEKKHLAPNDYLHAGAVVSLADSACGIGCLTNLPKGAHSFTTIELKCNMLGTARSGKISATSHCIHGGRTTQVWDATVITCDTEKVIAQFRCTQLILYP